MEKLAVERNCKNCAHLKKKGANYTAPSSSNQLVRKIFAETSKQNKTKTDSNYAFITEFWESHVHYTLKPIGSPCQNHQVDLKIV